jgi:hypothetical protein
MTRIASDWEFDDSLERSANCLKQMWGHPSLGNDGANRAVTVRSLRVGSGLKIERRALHLHKRHGIV